ncbi:MAG: AtpZ/AtpI family protein [Patescibacteria group bacterium]
MREPSDTPSRPPHEPPKNSTVLLLLGTIADTTWRMFVPIVGLLLLGVWVDRTYGTLPWATAALTILGIAIAAELVRRQLTNVNKK